MGPVVLTGLRVDPIGAQLVSNGAHRSSIAFNWSQLELIGVHLEPCGLQCNTNRVQRRSLEFKWSPRGAFEFPSCPPGHSGLRMVPAGAQWISNGVHMCSIEFRWYGVHFGGWRSQNSPKHPPGRGVFQGGWDGEGLAHTPMLVKTADPPRRMENGLGHGIPPEGPMATPLVTPPLWPVAVLAVRT